jgi:hypothetical protein
VRAPAFLKSPLNDVADDGPDFDLHAFRDFDWQSILRTRAHSQPSRPVSSTVSLGHDTRIPPPGTLLRRQFKGKPVLAKVLSAGFEHEGRIFASLSAIANEAPAATGTASSSSASQRAHAMAANYDPGGQELPILQPRIPQRISRSGIQLQSD